jgi:hypothetical protein
MHLFTPHSQPCVFFLSAALQFSHVIFKVSAFAKSAPTQISNENYLESRIRNINDRAYLNKPPICVGEFESLPINPGLISGLTAPKLDPNEIKIM